MLTSIFEIMTGTIQLEVLNIRPVTTPARIGMRSRIHLELLFIKLAGTFPEQLLNEDGDPDPTYVNQLRQWWELYLKVLNVEEEQLFSDNKYRYFRQRLINIPILSSCMSNSGTPNEDVNMTSRFSPNITSSATRDRTYNEVPLAGILYTTCSMLSQFGDYRSRINSHFINTKVPTYMNEVFASNRHSICGNFRIELQVSSFTDVQLSILGLEGTVFDIDYMKTDSGWTALSSLFSFMIHSEANYIKMADFKAFNIEAGYTTTATALNLEKSNISVEYNQTGNIRVEQKYVQFNIEGSRSMITAPVKQKWFTNDYSVHVLPGHSYGTKANAIQVFDAYVQHRVLYRELELQNQFYIGEMSPSITFSHNNNDIARFMVSRASGLTTNSNRTSEDTPFVPPADPSPAGNTNNGDTQSRRPRRQRDTSTSALNYRAQTHKILIDIFQSGYINKKSYLKLARTLV